MLGLFMVTIRVTVVQPLNVVLRDLIKIDVGPLGDLTQVPQDVTHFFDQSIVVEILTMERITLDQFHDLPRLTGKAQGTVGQNLFVPV